MQRRYAGALMSAFHPKQTLGELQPRHSVQLYCLHKTVQAVPATVIVMDTFAAMSNDLAGDGFWDT